MFYIETCTFSQSHTVLIEYYSKWVNSNSYLYLLAIWLISSCRAQFFFSTNCRHFLRLSNDTSIHLIGCWMVEMDVRARSHVSSLQTNAHTNLLIFIHNMVNLRFFLVINIDKIWFIYYILSTECFEKYWGRSASC